MRVLIIYISWFVARTTRESEEDLFLRKVEQTYCIKRCGLLFLRETSKLASIVRHAPVHSYRHYKYDHRKRTGTVFVNMSQPYYNPLPE